MKKQINFELIKILDRIGLLKNIYFLFNGDIYKKKGLIKTGEAFGYEIYFKKK